VSASASPSRAFAAAVGRERPGEVTGSPVAVPEPRCGVEPQRRWLVEVAEDLLEEGVGARCRPIVDERRGLDDDGLV